MKQLFEKSSYDSVQTFTHGTVSPAIHGARHTVVAGCGLDCGVLSEKNG